MRKYLSKTYVVTFLFPLTSFATIFDDPSATELVNFESPSKRALSMDIESSRYQAMTWTETTYNQAADQYKKLLEREYYRLQGAQVNVPDYGQDYKGCQRSGRNILAFVVRGDSRNIYVCAYARDTEYGDVLPLAQIFLHEAAHLQGYYNECDATWIEINIVWGGGSELIFENGYMQECGFENKKPILTMRSRNL